MCTLSRPLVRYAGHVPSLGWDQRIIKMPAYFNSFKTSTSTTVYKIILYNNYHWQTRLLTTYINYQVVGTVVSFLSMIFLAMPLTIIVSSFSKTYKDSKKGGGNQYCIHTDLLIFFLNKKCVLRIPAGRRWYPFLLTTNIKSYHIKDTRRAR